MPFLKRHTTFWIGLNIPKCVNTLKNSSKPFIFRILELEIARVKSL